jgi:serine/threonine protein kinase
VDSKTDIWSFGCVLFEIITLESLFGNKALHLVIGDILTKEIQALKGVDDDLSNVLYR